LRDLRVKNEFFVRLQLLPQYSMITLDALKQAFLKNIFLALKNIISLKLNSQIAVTGMRKQSTEYKGGK
jgi:predicted transposase YdaD